MENQLHCNLYSEKPQQWQVLHEGQKTWAKQTQQVASIDDSSGHHPLTTSEESHIVQILLAMTLMMG